MVTDQAFVLVDQQASDGPSPESPDTSHHMEVYVLDLKTWHWTKLPAQDDAPRCVNGFTPVVIQVSFFSLCGLRSSTSHVWFLLQQRAADFLVFPVRSSTYLFFPDNLLLSIVHQ